MSLAQIKKIKNNSYLFKLLCVKRYLRLDYKLNSL